MKKRIKEVLGISANEANIFDEELHIPKLFAKDAIVKPAMFQKEDGIGIIIKKLKREDCDICLVVNPNGTFFGEIKDEDLLKIMADNALYFPLTKTLNRCYKRGIAWKTAKDMAVRHNHIVKEDMPINDVLGIIYRKKEQNVIVVDKKNKVRGVITPSSLLSLLAEY